VLVPQASAGKQAQCPYCNATIWVPSEPPVPEQTPIPEQTPAAVKADVDVASVLGGPQWEAFLKGGGEAVIGRTERAEAAAAGARPAPDTHLPWEGLRYEVKVCPTGGHTAGWDLGRLRGHGELQATPLGLALRVRHRGKTLDLDVPWGQLRDVKNELRSRGRFTARFQAAAGDLTLKVIVKRGDVAPLDRQLSNLAGA
jgi:hypothetical protein